MENATDALIMAGQVLIFIVALTVCISSFTELRSNIAEVIQQTETINMAKDGDAYINYIESNRSHSTRVVGAETVISSMYRSVKEDYVVYIKLLDSSDIGAAESKRYCIVYCKWRHSTSGKWSN